MPIEVVHTERWSEPLIQAALASYFDWQRNLVFPNVDAFGWESDILLVTKAMKVWEVEVKTSLSDWRADMAKDKWTRQNWSKISRFYYAFPYDILKDQQLPHWVPDFAGLIGMEWKQRKVWAREIRRPKVLGNWSMSERKLTKLYRSSYFRYWASRKRRPDEIGVVECRDDDLLQLIAEPYSTINPPGHVIPKTASGVPYGGG